ncbi:hypothetical protein JCM11491_002487 [Sporobolomyces phaffii]
MVRGLQGRKTSRVSIVATPFQVDAPPTTTSTTRFFDALPDEVIGAIIDHLRKPPASFHRGQRHLLPLCLVSRRFRRLAQPELFEEIWLPDAQKSSQGRRDVQLLLREGTKAWLGIARKVRIDAPHLTPIDFERLAELVQAAPKLERLMCHSGSDCLPAFSSSTLASLALSYLELKTCAPLVFPNLRELSLVRVKFPAEPDGSILHFLPSLRHVFIDPVPRSTPRDAETNFYESLLFRLCSFTFCLRTDVDMPRSILVNARNLLYECDVIENYVKRAKETHHLRITSTVGPEDAESTAKKWSKAIESINEPFVLKTVFLPSQFGLRHDDSTSTTPRRIGDLRNQFEKRGVTIVDEPEVPGNDPFGSRICRAFSQLLDSSFLNGTQPENSVWTELDNLVSPSLLASTTKPPIFLNLHQSSTTDSAAAVEALDDGSICVSFPLDFETEVSPGKTVVEQVQVVPHTIELVEVPIDNLKGTLAVEMTGRQALEPSEVVQTNRISSQTKWWDVARLVRRDGHEHAREDELSTKMNTVVVAKKVFDPPKDRLSVRATWWGYEIFLPEIVFLKFGNDVEPVLTALTYLSTGLALLLTKAPPLVVALPGFPLLQSLLPVLSAIVSAVTWYWKTMKKMDHGEGIILSATWVLPVAVVPRPLRRKTVEQTGKEAQDKLKGPEEANVDAEKEDAAGREMTRPNKLRRVLSRKRK